MIEIKFTCFKCGESQLISADDVEEKTIVPVCEKCYTSFEKRRLNYIKIITKMYKEYDILEETFKIE